MPKVQNMLDIKDDLLQCLIIFFHNKISGGVVKNELKQNKELPEELLEKL